MPRRGEGAVWLGKPERMLGPKQGTRFELVRRRRNPVRMTAVGREPPSNLLIAYDFQH